MFAINEKNIPNVLDSYLRNTISTFAEQPKIDWKTFLIIGSMYGR